MFVHVLFFASTCSLPKLPHTAVNLQRCCDFTRNPRTFVGLPWDSRSGRCLGGSCLQQSPVHPKVDGWINKTKHGQTMRSVIDPCSWHQNLWFSRSNFCWPHGHITKVVTLLILTSGTALFETLRHHQLLSSEMLIGGCNNPKIRSKMGLYIYILWILYYQILFLDYQCVGWLISCLFQMLWTRMGCLCLQDFSFRSHGINIDLELVKAQSPLKMQPSSTSWDHPIISTNLFVQENRFLALISLISKHAPPFQKSSAKGASILARTRALASFQLSPTTSRRANLMINQWI